MMDNDSNMPTRLIGSCGDTGQALSNWAGAFVWILGLGFKVWEKAASLLIHPKPQTSHPKPWRGFVGHAQCQSIGPLLLAILCLLIPAAAHGQADAIKVAGNWIQPVQMLTFENGQAIFVAPSGVESRLSLEEIEAMTLSTRPELAKAEVALAEGNESRAVAQFMQAAARTSRPWIKAWIGHRMQKPLIRLGRGEQAINAYAAMIHSDVPLIWLQTGPLEAGLSMTPAEMQRALGKLDRTALTLRNEQRGAVIDFRQRLANGESVEGGGMMTLGEAEWANQSVVPLPSPVRINRGVQLLAAGEFDQAQTWLQTELADKPGSGVAHGQKLFLLGVVEQALAEKNSDVDGYRRASLRYMRLVVHFGDHALVPFALVQAAECHLAFGHVDGAQQLYNAVMAKGGIGEATEPSFYAKQTKIQAALEQGGAKQ